MLFFKYKLTRIFSEDKKEIEFYSIKKISEYIYNNILCETCKRNVDDGGYYIEDYNGKEYFCEISSPAQAQCAKILKVERVTYHI